MSRTYSGIIWVVGSATVGDGERVDLVCVCWSGGNGRIQMVSRGGAIFTIDWILL
jgi:hypothetical protein